MSFETAVTTATGDDGLTRRRGPRRTPAQMLAEQTYGGGLSVHDDENAARLGLQGAPIEGPTHFSQIDPLAVDRFGPEWFVSGCLSAHFQTMVVEGEEVVAELADTPDGATTRFDAWKADETPVMTGTATLGSAPETELDRRRARQAEREVGDLHIVDQLVPLVGDVVGAREVVTVTFDSHNGPLYPFTLGQKLDVITERSTWYDGESPWGRPILPTEMLSVLAHQRGPALPVRRPSLGLFIDLEVRYVDGPVVVGEAYEVVHRLLQVGQSRSVESWWTESSVIAVASGSHVATVLLHQGVFKASFPDYPSEEDPAPV